MNNKMFDSYMMVMGLLFGGAALILGLSITGIVLICKGHIVWGFTSVAASIGLGLVGKRFFVGSRW